MAYTGGKGREGARAWQLRIIGNTAEFHMAALPPEFYEMAPPYRASGLYVAFKADRNGPRHAPAVFGITLPNAVARAIQDAMQQHSGERS